MMPVAADKTMVAQPKVEGMNAAASAACRAQAWLVAALQALIQYLVPWLARDQFPPGHANMATGLLDLDNTSKVTESIRRIQKLLDGRNNSQGTALYSSPHTRLRLYIKVPEPWDPEHLHADFPQRLALELSRAGFCLAGAAVRRGCIELSVDVVLPAPHSNQFQDSAFEELEQHPVLQPLQPILRALALPLGTVTLVSSAGLALVFKHTGPHGMGTGAWCCVPGGQENHSDGALRAVLASGSDLPGAASGLVPAGGPAAVAVWPLCAVLAPAQHPAGTTTTGVDAHAASQLPLQLVLHEQGMTQAGATVAVRHSAGYLTSSNTPLPDGLGVSVLVSVCGCSRGLLHIEVRCASARVMASCSVLLVHDAGLAAELCTALEDVVTRAAGTQDTSLLQSLQEMITDLGAWYEYLDAVRSTRGQGRWLPTVVAGAPLAGATGDCDSAALATTAGLVSATLPAAAMVAVSGTAVAAAAGPGAQGAGVACCAGVQPSTTSSPMATAISSALCSTSYSRIMTDTAYALLCEATLRGWPLLAASLTADLVAQGESPTAVLEHLELHAASATTALFTLAPAPAPQRPLQPCSAPQNTHQAAVTARAPLFTASAAAHATSLPPVRGEVQASLRGLVWGFPGADDEARYVRYATSAGTEAARTWLILSFLFLAILVYRIALAGMWASLISAFVWAVPPSYTALLYWQDRQAYILHRERLFMAFGVSRIATRLLIIAGLPTLPLLAEVCVKHQDLVTDVVLPVVAEKVRLRISLPLLLVNAMAGVLMYLRIGLYNGEMLPCVLHSITDSAVWLVLAGVLELRGRICFLRQSAAQGQGQGAKRPGKAL